MVRFEPPDLLGVAPESAFTADITDEQPSSVAPIGTVSYTQALMHMYSVICLLR